jgi:riboflavin synthase
MFTGIIEALGTVAEVHSKGTNLDFLIRSAISHELHVDQSISHDGVCLTVTAVEQDAHRVTAVSETLHRTTLANWEPGTMVNLERCLRADGRLDGHIVQGHVDATGVLQHIEEQGGSWKLRFQHDKNAGMTVEKGSIAVNGISLTVVDSTDDSFSVVIIPYTWEHTNLSKILPGMSINLEFDILGKYLQKLHRSGV